MQKFKVILFFKKPHGNHILSLSGSTFFPLQIRNIKKVKPKNKFMEIFEIFHLPNKRK